MSDRQAGRQTASAPRAPSAHVDTFARDRLPPPELWPAMPGVQALGYGDRLNVADLLLDEWVARGLGDRAALHFPGGRWSFRDLMERSNRIANVLVDELEVRPGHRVLLRGPNTPMMIASWFAVLKAGGICVATMPLLRPREIGAIADAAAVSLALCDARVADDCERARDQFGSFERIVRFQSEDADGLEAMISRKPATFHPVATAADDVALIAFTSGTTGRPKGTLHFHRDLLAICDTYARHVLRLTPDDITCGSPPVAFTFGLGGLVLFPMRVGASSLLLEQGSPAMLLQGIAEHRATVSFTAPTAYRAMAGMAGSGETSSLRACVSAGEHLPAATFEQWRAATGIEILDGIGSTEMLHIFIGSPPGEVRAGSTGRVVPGYFARVVDADGVELPAGEVGHLAVQGPTGCRYLDNEERQRDYVREGWNYPGDSYRRDSEGYFWYQARTDDLIVSSGYKIPGPEVESALLEHHAVAECGVIGVPDEERGQRVTAFVVLRAGHDPNGAMVKELQEFVKAQIAPYKYPRGIEFVASLPRTETGKLQRFRLRDPRKMLEHRTPEDNT
ncbi:MAG TPA: AMP-binding protein [Gemmatimonadaceae bacterium]|nr:AMP-binding protein [Gemmatimonadaceae bacterium]